MALRPWGRPGTAWDIANSQVFCFVAVFSTVVNPFWAKNGWANFRRGCGLSLTCLVLLEGYLHLVPKGSSPRYCHSLHSHLVRGSHRWPRVCTLGVCLPRGINHLAALSCLPMLRSHLFPASRAETLQLLHRKELGCLSFSTRFERRSMVCIASDSCGWKWHLQFGRYGVVIHGDMSFDGGTLPIHVSAIWPKWVSLFTRLHLTI